MKRTTLHGLNRMRRGLALVCLLALGAVPVAAQSLPLADRAMPTADGSETRLSEQMGSLGLVVAFWSNSCPWVEKNEARLLELANRYRSRGVGFVVVNSNDANAYPDEQASALADQGKNYGFPYVIDTGAELARAVGAQRTPEIFVFNASGARVYAGAIDDSPALADKVTTPYLQSALEALVVGQAVAEAMTKSIGCTIKFP